MSWLKSFAAFRNIHEFAIEEQPDWKVDWEHIDKPETTWVWLINEPEFKIAYDNSYVIVYVKKKR